MTNANTKQTAENKGKTENLRPFTKGKSGNPGGRPKKTQEEFELIAACRTKAPEALEVLVDIMQNGQQERSRITAANTIIERAYGKATQHIEGSIENPAQEPKEISNIEAARRMAFALELGMRAKNKQSTSLENTISTLLE